MYPTDSGLLFIDDLGNADGFAQIEAAALRYNRSGETVAKKGLRHGIYRIGVHPLGHGLIAMSNDCVLHVYDDNLEPILETSLAQAPEILALMQRFEIPEDQLKNHIRCVSLSQNATRYFFTAVDEAWCVDMDGKGVWGLKMPLKDGWTQVAKPSGEFGTSDEVSRALSLMGLSLPLSPENLKSRYHELAKQMHPDLNPQNIQAHEKMKELNAAAELLTGIDSVALPKYTGVSFAQEIENIEFEVNGEILNLNIGMSVDEIYASDWIYAASFAGKSDASYIASYSGRVVMISDKGEALRVYDIGNIPSRIVDTGEYLYLLTATRLYVLRDNALHALVDTSDGGELLVAQTGFGLLEKKRLRWFNKEGKYLGSIISKNPIRRIYSRGEGIVIETRQRRAFINGIPAWWK
ncbi:MAG: DnaJ domain-containing protein [Candidatus Dadabacteria bacterium]|nr:DnaJ domain-containing protein [Candidatus Dadabacteria bacterium]